MAANKYTVGAQVRVSGTFTVSSVATDPTTLTVKIKAPGGTVTTYVYGTDAAVTKTGTGAYYIDVDANASGDWWVRFAGTGTAKAADEHVFVVQGSEF